MSGIEKATKIAGLILIVIMLLSHIFYKEIDLTLLIIPAIMLGLDVNKFLKK